MNDCPVNKFLGGLAALYTVSDCARERMAAAPSELHTIKKERTDTYYRTAA